MSERFTKPAARNAFYGGSIFFFVVFVALTAHSHWYMLNASTDVATLSPGVERGKEVWERNACINCHTLQGRYGIEDTRAAIQAARTAGVRVFGVTVDEEARDYVPYLFGRGAYAILPDVERLPAALPQIHRQIVRS